MSLGSALSLSLKQGQPAARGTCVETQLPGKQQRKITTMRFASSFVLHWCRCKAVPAEGGEERANHSSLRYFLPQGRMSIHLVSSENRPVAPVTIPKRPAIAWLLIPLDLLCTSVLKAVIEGWKMPESPFYLLRISWTPIKQCFWVFGDKEAV